MSIQVPIGKGIIKFPKIPRSKPEFEKKPFLDQINSDLQFLRLLSQDDRLVIETNTGTTSGDMITVTPATGTTFFFLGAAVTNTDAGGLTGNFQLTNNGIVRDFVRLTDIQTHTFSLPIDRLVGTGMDSFILEALTTNVNSESALYGWNENTEKIS